MQVKLLSYTKDAEKLCAAAAHSCYSKESSSEILDNIDTKNWARLLEAPLSMGHQSVIEHACYTFNICGISRACYDDKTEVFTSNGWKLFQDLNDEDRPLSMTQRGDACFQNWTDFTRYWYSGKMHHYLSQNVDLMVTPDHELFIKKYDVRTEVDFGNVPSQDIKIKRFYVTKAISNKVEVESTILIRGYEFDRKNNCGGTFKKHTGDLLLDRKTFYRFLAWFISEGSLHHNKKENSARIIVSQMKESNRKHIEHIIRDLGFHTYSDSRQIQFKSLTMWKYLSSLGKSHEKRIPFDLFANFDGELARAFLEEYVKGDGSHESNGHKRIYTTSRTLADQLQLLSHIAGYSSKIWVDDRRGTSQYSKVIGRPVRHNDLCYVISLSCGQRNNSVVIKRDKHLHLQDYEGYVYCVEVPGHVLFVRRNGITLWCGNCTHQLVRHRIASFSQKSQRYVSIEKPDYVIPPSISNEEEAKERFRSLMDKIWEEYAYLSKIVPIEDARYVLPNATTTHITVTMNARELWHFFSLRCCNRTQWELKEVADKMLTLAREVSPLIFKNAGPACLRGKCPEGKMSCSKPRTELLMKN